MLPVTVLAQAPPAAGVPQTDEEKTLYAVGLVMARSLRQFDLSAAELEFIRRAIADAQAGKPAVDLDEWGPKIQALVTARGERIVGREKEASAAYLAKAAAEAGALRTESGIVYIESAAGTGVSPTPPIASRCTTVAPSSMAPSSTAPTPGTSPPCFRWGA